MPGARPLSASPDSLLATLAPLRRGCAVAPGDPSSSPAGTATPASSRIRTILKRSFRLVGLLPLPASSSNLLSIISGLLFRVATELVVFLRRDCGGEVSLSLIPELRESQENGLVSLRLGAGGAPDWMVGAARADGDEARLFAGDSEFGDHGIEGRAFAKPPNDKVFDEVSFGAGSLLASSAAGRSVSAACRSPCE